MDPLTELEAELEAEKGHSTLTNENKILRKKACLSSFRSQMRYSMIGQGADAKGTAKGYRIHIFFLYCEKMAFGLKHF
jgi:hypothetical protein